MVIEKLLLLGELLATGTSVAVGPQELTLVLGGGTALSALIMGLARLRSKPHYHLQQAKNKINPYFTITRD